MGISEQVKELREFAKPNATICSWKTKDLLNKAADTIEALSAKLEKSNMERSEADYGVEWIPCSERLPEEDSDVLIYTPYNGVDMAYISDGNWRYTRGDEFIDTIVNVNILAWRSLPEPYIENEKRVE